MAKTQVDENVAMGAVKKIIFKAADIRGKRFTIESKGNKRYIIIPKVVVASGDLFLDFSKTLLEPHAISQIESVVIDVIGLKDKKVTRIEIFKDGTVVYSPKIGRNENEVKKLVKMLSKNSQVN